jgi:hypothetical protein
MKSSIQKSRKETITSINSKTGPVSDEDELETTSLMAYNIESPSANKDVNKQGEERVIYIWSVPANGHLNPTLCFTNQLLLRLAEMKVHKVIFYSSSSFEQPILDLPNNVNKKLIEFRDYDLEKHCGSENMLKIMMNFDTKPGSLFRVFQCFENSLKLASKHLMKSLLTDIDREKPVLILYDQALFFPKIALKLYTKKYKHNPRPLHACYVTTFMCAKDIYPLWGELNKMGLLGNNKRLHRKLKNGLLTGLDFLKYCVVYYKTLWWDLGFSTYDCMAKLEYPVGRNNLIDESLNLVFVMPEMQPKLKAFQSEHIKFVGPCVDENVRGKLSKEKSNMDTYIRMIDQFMEKNAKNSLGEHSLQLFLD